MTFLYDFSLFQYKLLLILPKSTVKCGEVAAVVSVTTVHNLGVLVN